MPGKVLQDACADCQSVEAAFAIRTRRLCRDCFIRYVNSKVLKRMESYRFKNDGDDSVRRLLLPVSGGVSSLVLLQVLDAQLQRQLAKRNRTAYELVVVLIYDDSQGVGVHGTQGSAWCTALQSRFPSVSFMSMKKLCDVLAMDDAVEDDLKTFGMTRFVAEPNEAFLQRVLWSPSSLTASADLQEILLNRLVVSCAKQHDCRSILWGHSDSRLAAKALAGVAKGRGGSLPFEICDGPHGSGINFNFPVRDLFKSELSLYSSLLPEAFSSLVQKDEPAPREKVSIRNTSIDDLLTNYITSQGEKYPSIIANVVRTTSKLQRPDLSDGLSSCRICLMPYQANFAQAPGQKNLCYACSRIHRDIREATC